MNQTPPAKPQGQGADLKTRREAPIKKGAGRRPRGEVYATLTLPDVEDCPRCAGEGREIIERDGLPSVRICDCRRARRKVQLYNRAHIPRVLSACRIDADPQQEGRPFLPEHGPEQARALEEVRVFVDSYLEARDEGRGFVLMGKPGTGKSHLLAGVLRALTLELGVPARYVEFFHLLSKLKDGFSQGKSELEVISPLAEIEILAIDELGKGRGSEWELYVMDEIISRRYNAGRTTLYATNYTLDRRSTLAGGKGVYERTGGEAFNERLSAETLEERVGTRIFSRLFETSVFLDLGATTPDYRRKPRHTG